jgi:histidinol-phosphate aminotransferase
MKNSLFNIDKLVRANIAQLKPYSSARDEFSELDRKMIYLDANENPVGDSLNRYPDPFQLKLKSKLSKLKNIPVKNILLGNGSDEVLDLIFRAFCEPGSDQIITMPPTYGMYNVLARTNDIENIEVLLTKKFQIATNEIKNHFNNSTKLIFICSPNNPTGNLMDRSAIKMILEEFNGLLIIDEAYIDFSNSESWIGEIKKYQNLIVIQTLSKAYGLAGIRLGMCYADHKIIEVLNKIKAPYNVNQLTQDKAMEVLKKSKEYRKQVIDCISNKQELVKELRSINCVKKIYPSDSNFILIEVDDANKRYLQLLENGIVVRNRTDEPLCKDCLRITIGTLIELEKLIQTLKKYDI